MGLVLITHDMGVVAETADRVIVQYAGRQVEHSRTRNLFRDPHHPYTHGLLAALPERATGRRLPAIAGVVPGQFDRPPGCLFAPRCAVRVRSLPQSAPTAGECRARPCAVLDAAGRGQAACSRGPGMTVVLEARNLTRDLRGQPQPVRGAILGQGAGRTCRSRSSRARRSRWSANPAPASRPSRG